MTEVIVAFSENQTVTPIEIAASHLRVRQNQEDMGTNQFSDILDSQNDLLDLREYYVGNGGNFFVALTDAGDLQGFVGLRNDGDGRATLKRLAVLPAYEGRGVGGRLVAQLIEWAEQNGFRQIVLQTGGDELARERIYKKVGFRDVGRVPKENKTDEYLMELDLNL